MIKVEDINKFVLITNKSEESCINIKGGGTFLYPVCYFT